MPALALAGAALGTVLAAAAPPTLPPVLAVGATPAAQERLGAPRGWPQSLTIGRRLPGSAPAPPVQALATPTPGRLGVPLAQAEPVLAIGDSVLLAATPALQSALGSQITVDAAVGRQVDQGLARLADYRASGVLAHFRTLVVDLGTNGSFSKDQFDRLVELSAGVPRVVVFDVYGDRPWTGPDDAVIRAGVAAHPEQMVLADWAGVASADLLYPDGIHPNPEGASRYEQLLVTCLAAYLASPPAQVGPQRVDGAYPAFIRARGVESL